MEYAIDTRCIHGEGHRHPDENCAILNALDNSILEETDSAGETDGRSLRGAVNDCVWKELNHSIT